VLAAADRRGPRQARLDLSQASLGLRFSR